MDRLVQLGDHGLDSVIVQVQPTHIGAITSSYSLPLGANNLKGRALTKYKTPIDLWAGQRDNKKLALSGGDLYLACEVGNNEERTMLCCTASYHHRSKALNFCAFLLLILQ